MFQKVERGGGTNEGEKEVFEIEYLDDQLLEDLLNFDDNKTKNDWKHNLVAIAWNGLWRAL